MDTSKMIIGRKEDLLCDHNWVEITNYIKKCPNCGETKGYHYFGNPDPQKNWHSLSYLLSIDWIDKQSYYYQFKNPNSLKRIVLNLLLDEIN